MTNMTGVLMKGGKIWTKDRNSEGRGYEDSKGEDSHVTTVMRLQAKECCRWLANSKC